MESSFSFRKTNDRINKAFKEPLDTAVFTTKFVLEDNRDIIYVTHEEEDGAWQFFSADEFEDFEEIAKVVGLGEIIELDSSVLELAELPVGYCAYRENKSDYWKIKQLEE